MDAIKTKTLTWMQHHKQYIVQPLALVCGGGFYLLSSHTALFILCTIVGFTYYFAAKKPLPSRVFAVTYLLTSTLIAIYNLVEKLRTGTRPTWPIDYETQALRFTLGSFILTLSLKICELCGNWVPPDRYARMSLELLTLAACIAGMAESWWQKLSGALHAMSTVFAAELMLDREYLQGVADGTQPTFQQVWSAMVRGKLPKPPYITEEERTERIEDEKGLGLEERGNSSLEDAKAPTRVVM